MSIDEMQNKVVVGIKQLIQQHPDLAAVAANELGLSLVLDNVEVE